MTSLCQPGAVGAQLGILCTEGCRPLLPSLLSAPQTTVNSAPAACVTNGDTTHSLQAGEGVSNHLWAGGECDRHHHWSRSWLPLVLRLAGKAITPLPSLPVGVSPVVGRGSDWPGCFGERCPVSRLGFSSGGKGSLGPECHWGLMMHSAERLGTALVKTALHP
ncbi:hypothetical protein AAFF_G00000830 [Aldrovandia affinis]|uniref:Uncharacterized protein n=1 Tax=Aldrovandia affinis TaxID=143900 RepID=A0AAD7TCU4_9TELE|nr:hypothetical protein AAFF_G00000830 [Aldrovandia affinis]